MPADGAPDKLSIIVFSGDFERVHYALAMAAAAVATNIPVTLFFTMGATRALLAAGGPGTPGGEPTPGWHRLAPGASGAAPAARDHAFAVAGVATFDELLGACRDLGARFMVCEMGLRAEGLEAADLRDDIAVTRGGIVTFLADASANGQMVLI